MNNQYSIPEGCLKRIRNNSSEIVIIKKGDFGILKFEESLIIREIVSGFALTEIPTILKKRGIQDEVIDRISSPGFINDLLRKIKKKDNKLPLYKRIETWSAEKITDGELSILSFKEFWKINENILVLNKNLVNETETSAENIRLRVIIYLREVYKLHQPIEIDEDSFSV